MITSILVTPLAMRIGKNLIDVKLKGSRFCHVPNGSPIAAPPPEVIRIFHMVMTNTIRILAVQNGHAGFFKHLPRQAE